MWLQECHTSFSSASVLACPIQQKLILFQQKHILSNRSTFCPPKSSLHHRLSPAVENSKSPQPSPLVLSSLITPMWSTATSTPVLPALNTQGPWWFSAFSGHSPLLQCPAPHTIAQLSQSLSPLAGLSTWPSQASPDRSNGSLLYITSGLSLCLFYSHYLTVWAQNSTTNSPLGLQVPCWYFPAISKMYCTQQLLDTHLLDW